jgi:hypothetical protein
MSQSKKNNVEENNSSYEFGWSKSEKSVFDNSVIEPETMPKNDKTEEKEICVVNKKTLVEAKTFSQTNFSEETMRTIESKIEKIRAENGRDLRGALSVCLNTVNLNILTLIIISALLYEKEKGIKDLPAKIEKICKDNKRLSVKFKAAVIKSNEIPSNCKLSMLLDDEASSEIFEALKISTFGDLSKQIDFEKISAALSLKTEEFINTIDKMSDASVRQSMETLSSFYNSFDSKVRSILNRRYSDTPKTLQIIGTEMKVSRERIRQIEANSVKKLILASNGVYQSIVLALLIKTIPIYGGYYFTSDWLYANYGDSTGIIVMKILGQQKNAGYSYCYHFRFFENSKLYKTKDIIDRIQEKIGIVYRRKEVPADHTERLILNNYYHKVGEALLIKGISSNGLLLKLIKENYPQGFKPSNQEQVNDLKNKFEQLLGENSFHYETHNLTALLERGNEFSENQRGTYIPSELIPAIGGSLKESIAQFVKASNSIVYYRSILENFRSEFEELGVDNWYEVKSMVDPSIREFAHPKKDYILVNSKYKSTVEALTEKMNSFDEPFTFDEMRKEFIGVQNYVFSFVCFESQDYIALQPNKYISQKKLRIAEADVKALKNYIEETMLDCNSSVINSRALYKCIYIKHQDWLTRNKIIKCSFDLFSLSQAFLEDDFEFSRPDIADKNSYSKGDLTKDKIIKEKLSQLVKVNINDIKQLESKQSLVVTKGYKALMESMSEEYVIVSNGEMVRKDVLNLDQPTLLLISQLLNKLTSNSEEIDTTVFDKYWLFPKLNYSWNKYLLSGIVRSFFPDDYTVEASDGKFVSANFIIRRK